MTTAESTRKEAAAFLNNAADQGRKAARQFQKTAGKKLDRTWNHTTDAVRDAASSARGYVRKQGSRSFLGKLAGVIERNPALTAAIFTGVAVLAFSFIDRNNPETDSTL